MYRLIEREMDIGLGRDVAQRHRVDPTLGEEQRGRVEHGPSDFVSPDRGIRGTPRPRSTRTSIFRDRHRLGLRLREVRGNERMFHGGPPGARTRHLGIKSPLLYPMS